MFDFPSLSAINTIRAGLNLMLSVAIIVVVGASFIMIGFELTKETATTTWFDCGDGGRVSVNTLEDGEDNCNNGADEAEGIRNQYIQEETGLLSLIFHGVGILVLVAGSLGLLTKVIADGVSAAINLNKHGLVDERQSSIGE